MGFFPVFNFDFSHLFSLNTSCIFVPTDADFPLIEVKPEDVLGVVGQSAEFHCSFKGNPDPVIDWYFRWSEEGTNVVHLANGTRLVRISLLNHSISV